MSNPSIERSDGQGGFGELPFPPRTSTSSSTGANVPNPRKRPATAGGDGPARKRAQIGGLRNIRPLPRPKNPTPQAPPRPAPYPQVDNIPPSPLDLNNGWQGLPNLVQDPNPVQDPNSNAQFFAVGIEKGTRKRVLIPDYVDFERERQGEVRMKYAFPYGGFKELKGAGEFALDKDTSTWATPDKKEVAENLTGKFGLSKNERELWLDSERFWEPRIGGRDGRGNE